MFVTFEGCEGVGKSTQLRLLKEYLEKTGQEALYIREPGSTSISEQIRQVILDPNNSEMRDATEALLYAASRAQLVREVIKPALAEGKLVICDRFVDSSVAYQGYGRGMGADAVWEINKIALDGVLPDLTIFIDLPPDKSFRGTRMDDRLERESNEFFAKVYKGFLAQIDISSDRFVRIIPQIDKFATSQSIIEAMRKRGAIK